MGCLTAMAALLALAIPASIAPASLVGAYVVLALLAAAGAAAIVYAGERRRRRTPGVPRKRSTALWRLAGLTAVYAAVVAVIHVLT